MSRQLRWNSLLVVILAFFIQSASAWAQNNIVLLMDNSGSMRQNDPECWSKSSAEFFVSRCQATDSISIIPFDSSLRRNERLKFTNPVGSRQDIVKFISGMDHKGPWTDFNWALRAAYEELKGREGNKYVILFTDGEPDPDPKDKTYSGVKDRAGMNRQLSLEVIRQLYAPEKIKIFSIAFTNTSDIDFLKSISKECNGSYDFCFRADQSYNLSDVFFKISNFIPVLSNWFSYGIYVPPELSKSFILVNLDKRLSQREYINQSILDGISQLAESSQRKGIPIVPYHWPQLAQASRAEDVAGQLSKVQKLFIVLDFLQDGQTAEYYIYDFSNSRKNLLSHKRITLGILSELCGRLAEEMFADLKDYKLRKETVLPVTVKYLDTNQPAVAEVTFSQGGEQLTEYTDAYGHAILVGDAGEPFKISFAAGGVKLGEWDSASYQPGKVFYLAAGCNVSVKVQAIPPDYDELNPQNKAAAPKKELTAQVELETLAKKVAAQSPCVFPKIPIGLRKLSVAKPADAWLPYAGYINVTPADINPGSKLLEETITLDRDYLADINKLVAAGKLRDAEDRAQRLVYLHPDHPQVFDIFSLIVQANRSQKNYSRALEMLAWFQDKYKDKYFYRKPEGLPKDQFLLAMRLAELKLINNLDKPVAEDMLGLSDLKTAAGFLNQCQNSMTAALKIANLEAMEFYLYYALAEFKAGQLAGGRQDDAWRRYFARYKTMLEKGNYADSPTAKLLDADGLQKLLAEVEAAYNGQSQKSLIPAGVSGNSGL